MVKIKKTRTGNCSCRNCGKGDGNYQPWTVWHKDEDETRGQNEPVCSRECAEALAKRFK